MLFQNHNIIRIFYIPPQKKNFFHFSKYHNYLCFILRKSNKNILLFTYPHSYVFCTGFLNHTSKHWTFLSFSALFFIFSFFTLFLFAYSFFSYSLRVVCFYALCNVNIFYTFSMHTKRYQLRHKSDLLHSPLQRESQTFQLVSVLSYLGLRSFPLSFSKWNSKVSTCI